MKATVQQHFHPNPYSNHWDLQSYMVPFSFPGDLQPNSELPSAMVPKWLLLHPKGLGSTSVDTQSKGAVAVLPMWTPVNPNVSPKMWHNVSPIEWAQIQGDICQVSWAIRNYKIWWHDLQPFLSPSHPTPSHDAFSPPSYNSGTYQSIALCSSRALGSDYHYFTQCWLRVSLCWIRGIGGVTGMPYGMFIALSVSAGLVLGRQRLNRIRPLFFQRENG